MVYAVKFGHIFGAFQPKMFIIKVWIGSLYLYFGHYDRKNTPYRVQVANILN